MDTLDFDMIPIPETNQAAAVRATIFQPPESPELKNLASSYIS